LWVQTPLSTQIDWIKYLNEIKIDKNDFNNHKFNLFKNIEIFNIYDKKEFNDFLFENTFLNLNNEFFKFKFKNIKNLTFFYLFYFNKINKKKLNFTNKKKLFFYNIININLKKKHIKLNLTQNDKNVLQISPGIVYKKLNMNSKRSKKSFKLLNLMIKLFLKNMIKILKFKKFIINLNYLRKDVFLMLKILKRYINFKKIIFIYSLKKNTNFKFKKKKSIKKKLTKKFKNI
jgi:hypothetical protein